jgi:hypothetical protein
MCLSSSSEIVCLMLHKFKERTNCFFIYLIVEVVEAAAVLVILFLSVGVPLADGWAAHFQFLAKALS